MPITPAQRMPNSNRPRTAKEYSKKDAAIVHRPIMNMREGSVCKVPRRLTKQVSSSSEPNSLIMREKKTAWQAHMRRKVVLTAVVIASAKAIDCAFGMSISRTFSTSKSIESGEPR